MKRYRYIVDRLGEYEVTAHSPWAAKYRAFRAAQEAGYYMHRTFREFLFAIYTVRRAR